MDKYIEAFTSVPVLGIFASAVVMIVVASLWYSPLLFGKIWSRHSGIRPGDIHPSEARRGYVFATLTALATAYLLAVVAQHAIAHPTALYASVIFIWSFVMLEQTNSFVWERATFTLFLLHAFRSLTALVAGASVFLFWS